MSDIVETKQGVLYAIDNEEDFFNMLNEELGEEVANAFYGYTTDNDYIEELEIERRELLEENEMLSIVNFKLNNTIESILNGDTMDNPLNEVLHKIQMQLNDLRYSLQDLEKVSKAKKVIDIHSTMCKELKELDKLIGSIK